MKINKEKLIGLMYVVVCCACVLFLYSTPTTNPDTLDIITLLFVAIHGGHYFMTRDTSEKRIKDKEQ